MLKERKHQIGFFLKAQNPVSCFFSDVLLKEKFKIKGWKNIYQGNTKQKQADVAKLKQKH